MVGHQTLDLAIGVRVPASQSNKHTTVTAAGDRFYFSAVFACWCNLKGVSYEVHNQAINQPAIILWVYIY